MGRPGGREPKLFHQQVHKQPATLIARTRARVRPSACSSAWLASWLATGQGGAIDNRAAGDRQSGGPRRASRWVICCASRRLASGRLSTGRNASELRNRLASAQQLRALNRLCDTLRAAKPSAEVHLNSAHPPTCADRLPKRRPRQRHKWSRRQSHVSP